LLQKCSYLQRRLHCGLHISLRNKKNKPHLERSRKVASDENSEIIYMCIRNGLRQCQKDYLHFCGFKCNKIRLLSKIEDGRFRLSQRIPKA
jgi:hypothetical protein